MSWCLCVSSIHIRSHKTPATCISTGYRYVTLSLSFRQIFQTLEDFQSDYPDVGSFSLNRSTERKTSRHNFHAMDGALINHQALPHFGEGVEPASSLVRSVRLTVSFSLSTNEPRERLRPLTVTSPTRLVNDSADSKNRLGSSSIRR